MMWLNLSKVDAFKIIFVLKKVHIFIVGSLFHCPLYAIFFSCLDTWILFLTPK